MDVREFKKIGLMVVTLTFDLEIQGQTWCNAFNILLRTRHYLIGNHPLPQVSNCSELGVIVDNQLSFSHHILATTKKASRQSALILRCFLSRDALSLKLAFYAYVCPILEYASPIWSPHTQKGIDLLENVQRHFIKSISKLHDLPYTTCLSSLNIPTLFCRRTHIDLCTVYRILHYYNCLDPSFHFSFCTESVTRGHPFTLFKPPVRLDSSEVFSFFSCYWPVEFSTFCSCLCRLFLCFQGSSDNYCYFNQSYLLVF